MRNRAGGGGLMMASSNGGYAVPPKEVTVPHDPSQSRDPYDPVPLTIPCLFCTSIMRRRT
jgi:hypothetical protein